MSEQRIELYATANDGFIRAYYRDRDLAMRMRHPDEQIIRLVEIRDGEPHPDDVPATIAALTERAEKAEAALKSFQPVIGGPTSLADWTIWKDRAYSAEEKLDDERARFERDVMRESYQRALTQMHWSANDLTESGLTYAQWSARQARDEAAVLTDAAFGFAPAKEV